MIALRKKLALLAPPKNSISIALHIREGGGYDAERARLDAPLKLPPLSYYFEALLKIASLFPNKSLYCQIFTDAAYPEILARICQNAIGPDIPIQFSYRKENSHDQNVVEDFFSLFNFDILIRPQSNFSIVPELLHDYAIVYSPVSAKIIDASVTIDKTDLKINPMLYQKLLHSY